MTIMESLFSTVDFRSEVLRNKQKRSQFQTNFCDGIPRTLIKVIFEGSGPRNKIQIFLQKWILLGLLSIGTSVSGKNEGREES